MTTATLLLVEDDARIREALRLALGDEGYDVVEAATGEQALTRLADEPLPDVVLLDLMLPGIDGLEVCARIREQGDLPIIMVTARTAPHEVIAGLEAGADDYVTKPVDAGELGARIRALLRRARAGENDLPSSLQLGDLTVRVTEGRVLRGSTEIPLTKTEFRLLCTLVTARGAVVTREQLLERVWDYGYFGDTRLLDVHIRRLRRKVEPDPGQPTHIVTVRGVGYRAESGAPPAQ
ncbi:response regulator transcription factor [Actinophytocola gossypii]|uniref:Response regulator transcription factor n=1 Tax=Actinophytocola gossypii TaxID=2812003 RepID=A0ABT2J748_9PSEU|nr:response regulator transcription factor [Actinophytocola gossypii]MCT2583688.1 response regulator transcription factor [Actinophytocola gossypii]